MKQSHIYVTVKLPKIRINRTQQESNIWPALTVILRNLKQGGRQKDASSTWTDIHKIQVEIMMGTYSEKTTWVVEELLGSTARIAHISGHEGFQKRML